MNSEIDQVYVRFTKRSVPIPVDYRPLYKIAQILLIIDLCGRGGKISLLKLQFFVWALRSPNNQRSFKALIEGERNYSLWSLDPTVIRAINFGIGEGLCERHNANIAITASGHRFALQLQNEMLLQTNILFLSDVGKQVTEQKVKQIARNWSK